MPRVRREELNEATRTEIKDTARALMAEKGTAGLSLRAIARNMGMTAPALYHYFGSLDDLITALILDAFNNHANYVRAVRDAAATEGQSHWEQILSAAMAYRQWALENTSDFQLIYGNPIPGYAAPGEITTPAAASMGQVFMETMMAGLQVGEFTLAKPYDDIPQTVTSHYTGRHLSAEAPPQVVKAFYVMNVGWSMMHGMVMLEIHNHLKPVVGDTDTFYRTEVIRHFNSFRAN